MLSEFHPHSVKFTKQCNAITMDWVQGEGKEYPVLFLPYLSVSLIFYYYFYIVNCGFWTAWLARDNNASNQIKNKHFYKWQTI